MVAQGQLQLIGPDILDLEEHRRTRPSSMSLRDVARWARSRLPAISRVTGVPQRSELFVMLQAVKLSEEVGELQAEVLGALKLQRSNKEQPYDASSLAAELADVILTTAVLSAVMDVDLSSAVSAKMDSVEAKMASAASRSR